MLVATFSDIPPLPFFFSSHNLSQVNIVSETFQAARRRVIASLQTITMYEYLPAFLGDSLKPYDGYKPDTHPGISHVFQSAAFRWVIVRTFMDRKVDSNGCQQFAMKIF